MPASGCIGISVQVFPLFSDYFPTSENMAFSDLPVIKHKCHRDCSNLLTGSCCCWRHGRDMFRVRKLTFDAALSSLRLSYMSIITIPSEWLTYPHSAPHAVKLPIACVLWQKLSSMEGFFLPIVSGSLHTTHHAIVGSVAGNF